MSDSPRSSRTRAKIASGSLIRPIPLLALGELARLGPDQLDAAGAQRRHVRLGGRVLPHAHVHRRRDEQRPPERERELGEHVVREPVRELRERVRRERRDHEQVGLDQVRVELARLLAAGERLEGARGDEALCLRVRTGVTSWPALTSRRVSSHAL